MFSDSDVGLDSHYPEEDADRLARVESFNKHLFRPNTYLHKWWARRCGTTFRYILKQLVPEPSLRGFYAPGGLDGATVLDPMMGGGTTLHEAIRLGANVIGYDLDPIPVLQARASLADLCIGEKQAVFEPFLVGLRKKLAVHFDTTCPRCGEQSETQFLLYGVRKNRGDTEVVVVDSFLLRMESNGGRLQLDDFYPERQVIQGNRSWAIVAKDEVEAGNVNGKDADILASRFAERYIPLVVAGACPRHGGFFKPVDGGDLQRIREAATCLSAMMCPSEAHFAVVPGPKSDDLLSRNVTTFLDVFSCRQLMYLCEAKRLMDESPSAHRLWLALLVSTSIEFNSMLCGYKGSDKRRAGAIRHVFSYHAYSFPYTALENNPVFSGCTSGTLERLFRSRIVAADKWAHALVERRIVAGRGQKIAIDGELDIGNECSSSREFTGRTRQFVVRQSDSSKILEPDQSVDFVVTDPPYFDSVQYSDLSKFFRCWLHWYLPDAADWDFLATRSAVAESAEAEQKFADVLSRIWQQCNRVLVRPRGRLIFTYHHWRASAWAQLTIALSKARFRLVNAYVVYSENPISVHIRDLRALKHDCILVLRPDDVKGNKQWKQPGEISTVQSEAFCRLCTQVLGWILDNDMDADATTRAWKTYLGGE